LEVLQEVGEVQSTCRGSKQRSDDRCCGAKQGRYLVPNDAQY